MNGASQRPGAEALGADLARDRREPVGEAGRGRQPVADHGLEAVVDLHDVERRAQLAQRAQVPAHVVGRDLGAEAVPRAPAAGHARGDRAPPSRGRRARPRARDPTRAARPRRRRGARSRPTAPGASGPPSTAERAASRSDLLGRVRELEPREPARVTREAEHEPGAARHAERGRGVGDEEAAASRRARAGSSTAGARARCAAPAGARPARASARATTTDGRARGSARRAARRAARAARVWPGSQRSGSSARTGQGAAPAFRHSSAITAPGQSLPSSTTKRELEPVARRGARAHAQRAAERRLDVLLAREVPHQGGGDAASRPRPPRRARRRFPPRRPRSRPRATAG